MAEKTAGIHIYLMEELTDARLRCEQVKRYVDQAMRLVNGSPQKAHIYEVAGDVLYGLPDVLFRLDKALDATALAASRLDYEELKQDLRPEKVEELENVLKDVRIRRFDRRAPQEMTMRKLATGSDVAAVLHHIAGVIEKEESQGKQPSSSKIAEALQAVITAMTPSANDAHRSRFEEGKPADPTENMSDEDADTWKEEHEKNKDNFKSAALDPAPVMGEEMVTQGVESMLNSARKAQAALTSGNVGKVFFNALGVLDGLGVLGRAYDLPDVGFLMRVRKAFLTLSSGRPSTNFSASEVPDDCTFKSAEDDEHFSRFEEGKPADPTENMSAEDAKTWKEEHEKNKDNFKSAAKDDPRWIHAKYAGTTQDGTKFKAGDLVLYYPRTKTFMAGKKAEDAWRKFEIEVTEEDAYSSKSATLAPPPPQGSEEQVGMGVEEIMMYARKAMAAYAQGNTGKMFYALLGILDGVGVIGTAYDVPTQPLMLLRKNIAPMSSGRPMVNFASAEPVARFEAGKPADPTQNMTDEDAATWKAMNEEHRDNFKAAADEQVIDDSYLVSTAQAFNRNFAKTRFIKGTPEVKQQGSSLFLSVAFQPYNDAKVDSFSVFIKDGETKAKVSVWGSYVGEGVDVETEGFGQRGAKGDVDLKNMDPVKFAAWIAKLSKKMK